MSTLATPAGANANSPSATYTTIEAARLMGLAVRSVQLMVDRGELEAWKTAGGHRRISTASVHQWLERLRGAAVPSPAPDRGASGSRPPGTGTSADAGATAPAPTRVLLIEDSKHYQNLMRLLIGQKFPQVELHVADEGIAGLAMAGQLQPQVMLVDILLPGIDGATLITSLRTNPQFQGSSLIVVTSLDEEQRRPYEFALADVPVVHKTQLVTALPPLLQATLDRVRLGAEAAAAS